MHILRTFFIAVTLLAGLLPAVHADPLPDGSYLQSCRHMAFERGVLRAECRTREGRWMATSRRYC